MFFVVVSHAGDTFNCNAPAGEAAYPFWGGAWGSLARFCVPVFAMITGYLLLPSTMEWGSFVRKRVGRVLVPFVFWSIVYCLLPLAVRIAGGDASTLRIFVPFADCGAGARPALAALAAIPLNFCPLTTHMWYVYMLIGLYLAIPVFSPWYAKATERAKLGFLSLWGVSLFLPYVRVFFGDVWGECPWNGFGLLYPFSGFLGYAVLGSVLGRLPRLSWRRTLAIALPLFAAGFSVTWLGYRAAVRETGADYAKFADRIELFWTFCSPNVAAMSAAAFLFAKKFERLPAAACRALADINACGFGIYCAHYAFIGAIFRFVVAPLGLPIALQLPALALLSYIAVWGFVHSLRALPGGRIIA